MLVSEELTLNLLKYPIKTESIQLSKVSNQAQVGCEFEIHHNDISRYMELLV